MENVASKTLWYASIGRHLDLFLNFMDQVDFIDKLAVKYCMKHDADEIAVKYFLSHSEYDYLLISSDDVYGTPDHIRTLLRDVEEHDYPIMSGWNDYGKGLAALSVSSADRTAIQAKKITYASYNFVTLSQLITAQFGYPIIKAWFVGLPLTMIRRDILQKVPFRPFMYLKDQYCVTKRSQVQGRGIMQDLQFALDCEKNNIPIMVDLRVFLLHLGGTYSLLLLGQKTPRVELTRRNHHDVEMVSAPINLEEYFPRKQTSTIMSENTASNSSRVKPLLKVERDSKSRGLDKYG